MSEIGLFLFGMLIFAAAFCGSLCYAYALLIGRDELDRVEGPLAPVHSELLEP